ncbi:MAG TPA: S41 family peptidase, partial [Rhodothermia bacterium]
MELDGITVPDDPTFLKRLMYARNLPRFVKEKLPPLHGEALEVPDDAVLSGAADETAVDPQTALTLREFLEERPRLSLEDRRRIIDQAILLLERYYVHLPMKRTMHAVDPIQRLRNLDHEIQQARGSQLSDLDFHREVITVFDSLRDLHTCYRLPQPFRGKVAWLPYLIEECVDDEGGRRFIVSKIVGKSNDDGFEEGVEVLHWNGVQIERHIQSLSRGMPGGNSAARRARALNSLTLRSLTRGQIPDEDWVSLRYRTKKGRVREHRQPWLLFAPQMGRRSLSPENFGLIEAAGLGLDDQTDDLQQAKKALFASAQVKEEGRLLAGGELKRSEGDDIPSTLPTIFRARHVYDADGTRYGYLRIFSFNVNDADLFVSEFERLLSEFSPKGLILDIRGNGGGLIHAAERTLELLSPVSIEPEPAQFINTPATLRLCRDHSASKRLPGLALKPWLGSIERSMASGATHSLGFPMTRREDCNRRGQKYQGPKVLIIDGLCYSAADMFAAGFKDHDLGPVIGLHDTTGAGGANVWSHRLLQFLSTDDADHGGFRLLPLGADLRTAVRRTLRVGPYAGELVEDFGIEPDILYSMTKNDVLQGNQELIRTVIGELKKMKSHRVSVKRAGDKLKIHSPGADSIEVTAKGRPVGTIDVDPAGRTTLDLSAAAAHGDELEIVAFADG